MKNSPAQNRSRRLQNDPRASKQIPLGQPFIVDRNAKNWTLDLGDFLSIRNGKLDVDVKRLRKELGL